MSSATRFLDKNPILVHFVFNVFIWSRDTQYNQSQAEVFQWRSL